MSPVSRGRKPTRKTKKRSGVSEERRQLLKTVLADAEDALAERDPIEVELIASTILGDFWQPFDAGRDVVVPLIDDAARKPSPASRALLRMVQHLALTEEQRDRAAAAADAFTAMPEPPWAGALRELTVTGCWQQADVFGDGATLLLRCDRAGHDHGIVAEVEFSGGGMGDVYLTDEPDALLAGMRAGAEASEVMVTGQIPLPRARRILEDAVAVNDHAAALLPDGLAEDPLTPLRALLAARLRVMPPAEPPEEPRAYSEAERDELVRAFLDEAGGPRDDRWFTDCVRFVVDYGCDDDFGRPLRVGPGKFDLLLEDVLNTEGFPPDFLETLPEVLPSWARWAGARSGLRPAAIDRLLEELDEVVEEFRDLLAEEDADFDHEAEGAAPIALRRE